MDKFSNGGPVLDSWSYSTYSLVVSFLFFSFFPRWFLVISMADLGLSLNILLAFISWQHGVVRPMEEESFNNWLIKPNGTEKNIN